MAGGTRSTGRSGSAGRTGSIAAHRRAIALKADFPEAYTNLGNALKGQGNIAAAIAACRQAIALNPDLPDAHHNLSLTLLLNGEFAEGWREYEWRWQTKQLRPRGFAQPLWSGEAVDGRVLLLHAEQGYGDMIQFCRYVPLVAARGRVVLEAPRALVRLFSGLAGVERIVVQGDPLPAFDLHCPLLSLPRAFATTLETIPGGVPYLGTDPAQVSAWRDRLAGLARLRVGLVWAGEPRATDRIRGAVDRRRSISLGHFARLAGVGGIAFVSLQKGEAAAQTRSPPPGLRLHDWTGELEDFADTAALIAALDLVISVDTAVVHLAGALGKPVWLLNRFDTDWRWLLDREDSPWYPTLRLFRQHRPGDWAGVLERVAAALRRPACS